MTTAKENWLHDMNLAGVELIPEQEIDFPIDKPAATIQTRITGKTFNHRLKVSGPSPTIQPRRVDITALRDFQNEPQFISTLEVPSQDRPLKTIPLPNALESESAVPIINPSLKNTLRQKGGTSLTNWPIAEKKGVSLRAGENPEMDALPLSKYNQTKERWLR